MKRLFAILAVALLVAACGNGEKKPKSIEEQLYEYVGKMEAAAKLNNYDKAVKIYMDYEKWVGTLNEAQLEELMIVLDKVDERLYILDEVGSSMYGDEEPEPEIEVPMVYANSYDGYLNVRAQPTTQSQILARLNNGPDGAELLGVEGSWSKVRVNGVVGYVSSKYLQSTPTDPVYIDASAVVGDWLGDCSGVLTIKSNGKFEHTFGFSAMSETVGGSWYLSRKSVVLKYSNGTVVICYVDGQTMSSDEDETFSRL